MKFTTFRNLLVAAVASGLLGSVYYATRSAAVTPTTTPTPGATASTTSATGSPKADTKSDPAAGSKADPVIPAETNSAAGSSEQKAMRGMVAEVAKNGHPLLAMRPFDEEIIRLFEQTPSSGKVKDATPDRPYKVNLYAEGGKHVRAKVDLNRNNKWDEKWSVEEKNGERIYKRQVSPSDDDTNYPDKFKLRHKMWEKTEP